MKRIKIPADVLLSVQFVAAQAYPNEVGGILTARRGRMVSAVPYVAPSVSTPSRLGISAEHSDLAHEIFHDMVGEYHTHPSATPTLSRVSDCTAWDNRAGTQSDEESMDPGHIEWVISIWPGKRRGWCFRHKIYYKDLQERIRRVSITWA